MVGCFERIMPLSVIGKVPRDGMISPPGIIPESIITTSRQCTYTHSLHSRIWFVYRNWWIVGDQANYAKKRKQESLIIENLDILTSGNSNQHIATVGFIIISSFNFNWFLLHKKVSGKLLAMSCTFLDGSGKWKVLAKQSFQSGPNYWHISEYMKQIWNRYWQIFKHADDQVLEVLIYHFALLFRQYHAWNCCCIKTLNLINLLLTYRI